MANDDNENINFFLDETEDSNNDILDLSEFINITETEKKLRERNNRNMDEYAKAIKKGDLKFIDMDDGVSCLFLVLLLVNK